MKHILPLTVVVMVLASPALVAQRPRFATPGPKTTDGKRDPKGSGTTGTMIERFRRPNHGSLVIEVTIDDPKAYTTPFAATVNNRLLPDTQLTEFVCIDKSAQHYVGANGKP